MVTRLVYYVHGRGRGHASRALHVVPALRRAGYELTLIGAHDALPVLRELGEVQERPLLTTGLLGARKLLARARQEVRALRSTQVDAVISDGDQAALLAAALLGVPALALGHDLVFSRCQLPRGLPVRWLLHQRLNALIPSRLSNRRVAVHFTPCISLDPHTRVARAALEPALLAPVREPRTQRLVCYFRDSNGSTVLTHARAMCDDVIAVDGASGTLQAPEAFRRLLQTSAGVIASAGSNVLSECVLLQTPLLALYRENDPEQALNARLLAAAGVGMACSFERVDAGLVREFWQRARSGQFAQVAQIMLLPSVADAVVTSLGELLGARETGAPGLRAHGPTPVHEAGL